LNALLFFLRVKGTLFCFSFFPYFSSPPFLQGTFVSSLPSTTFPLVSFPSFFEPCDDFYSFFFFFSGWVPSAVPTRRPRPVALERAAPPFPQCFFFPPPLLRKYFLGHCLLSLRLMDRCSFPPAWTHFQRMAFSPFADFAGFQLVGSPFFFFPSSLSVVGFLPPVCRVFFFFFSSGTAPLFAFQRIFCGVLLFSFFVSLVETGAPPFPPFFWTP